MAKHATDGSSLPYFAYGSNMLERRMRSRAPSVRLIGAAHLDDHRLLFDKRGRDGSGKANVVAAAGSRVYGVLFAIEPADVPALDRAEGGYERRVVSVHAAGEPRDAFLYTALPSSRSATLQPFCWYRDCVVGGAREHGLPDEYVAAIAAVPCAVDGDSARARRNGMR